MTPSFYVELDVFSGRPNPIWPLTAEESGDLLTRINRLAPDGAAMPSGLGYRGFIVYRTETGVPERWLNVGGGAVRITEKNRMQQYRDTERVEEWLRNQAIDRGFGALIGGAPE